MRLLILLLFITLGTLGTSAYASGKTESDLRTGRQRRHQRRRNVNR